MVVPLLCNPCFGDSAFHGGCIKFARDGISKPDYLRRGSSEASGSALLVLCLWELCFSLASPLWELCYSLASCYGIFLERAVPFMYRLLPFLFFFFFLFSFSFSFVFIFSSTSHSPLSLSFLTNSFHPLFFSSFPPLSFPSPSFLFFFFVRGNCLYYVLSRCNR